MLASREAGRIRICFAFCVHDYVYTRAMAAKPAQAATSMGRCREDGGFARREDEGCSGPSPPLHDQGTASEDGDAQRAPLKSTASDLGGDEERRTVKRVVD